MPSAGLKKRQLPTLTREDFISSGGRRGDELHVRIAPRSFRNPVTTSVIFMVTSLEPFCVRPTTVVRSWGSWPNYHFHKRRLKPA